jgi:hypothetical protein
MNLKIQALVLILTALFTGCPNYDISKFKELKDQALQYQDIRIESNDTVRVNRVNFSRIGELKEENISSVVSKMKHLGIVNLINNESYSEFMIKSGYEFSEGVIYVGKNSIHIIGFNKLEKIGNDGWFRYQRCYTRYKY